jgi:hypothetical protein
MRARFAKRSLSSHLELHGGISPQKKETPNMSDQSQSDPAAEIARLARELEEAELYEQKLHDLIVAIRSERAAGHTARATPAQARALTAKCRPCSRGHAGDAMWMSPYPALRSKATISSSLYQVYATISSSRATMRPATRRS